MRITSTPHKSTEKGTARNQEPRFPRSSELSLPNRGKKQPEWQEQVSVDSPKLRYESPGQAGGKGSKQPRPRRLPRIHSPERNRTGGIKRSCGRQGDTRHTSPRVLAYALTPVARPTATRGTATTSHAAHSETARPGGINSGGGKVRSHRGVRGGRGLVRHWPASPGEGDGRDQGGMGGTGKSEPNPPGPRLQKAAVGCAGGSGVVGWGAYGRSVTENISAGGRGKGSPLLPARIVERTADRAASTTLSRLHREWVGAVSRGLGCHISACRDRELTTYATAKIRGCVDLPVARDALPLA